MILRWAEARIGVAAVLGAIIASRGRRGRVVRAGRVRGPAQAGAKLAPCPKHARPQRLRCGTIKVPYERADPSLGTTRVRPYAVRRRDDGGRPAGGRSSRSRAARATARSPARATTSTCSGRCSHAAIWCSSTCAAPAIRGRSTARSSSRGVAPTADGVAQCARILGDHYDVLPDLRRRRRHRRRPRARSGSTGSPSTATPTGPSWRSPTRSATATRSPRSVLDSAYPVRGESPWYPSLWRNGIRAL